MLTQCKDLKINIYSVHHTGTHFIKKLLEDHGWMNTPFEHFDRQHTPASITVAPIRDPAMTYVTWVSRKRDEVFEDLWGLFNQEFQNNPDLHICPIDTPDRQEHLDALAVKLKCELKTDWKPVASEPRRDVDVPDLTHIYNLPVVKKFGYMQGGAVCAT